MIMTKIPKVRLHGISRSLMTGQRKRVMKMVSTPPEDLALEGDKPKENKAFDVANQKPKKKAASKIGMW